MTIQRASKNAKAENEEARSRRLFEKFVPAAKALDAREIIACRSDVALAHRNVAHGVEAVLAHESAIRVELPKIDTLQIRTMPELSIAVVYAATQVDRHGPSKELGELLSRARDLRNLLLVTAESLAHAKIFEAREVAKIRAGRGDIDAAKDCIELSALFVKHAPSLRGKTPVTMAQIREAAAVGTELITLLKPKKVRLPKKVQDEVAEARDTRDRLWTLLVQRHDTLRRVGAYLFGLRELDIIVPALQTRVFVKRAAKKAAPKQPVEVMAMSGAPGTPGDTTEEA